MFPFSGAIVSWFEYEWLIMKGVNDKNLFNFIDVCVCVYVRATKTYRHSCSKLLDYMKKE